MAPALWATRRARIAWPTSAARSSPPLQQVRGATWPGYLVPWLMLCLYVVWWFYLGGWLVASAFFQCRELSTLFIGQVFARRGTAGRVVCPARHSLRPQLSAMSYLTAPASWPPLLPGCIMSHVLMGVLANL